MKMLGNPEERKGGRPQWDQIEQKKEGRET
jgi:hypothetical protein